MNRIKKFFLECYYSKGYKIGSYLLTNIVIAAICVILLNVFTGTKITISGAFEWLISLPIFAIIIMAVRLVRKIVPFSSAVAKFIADFIIIAAICAGVAFLMDKIPFPQSDILQMLIIIVFDIVYVAIAVFLLFAGKRI